MPMNARYRWAFPSEWLYEKINMASSSTKELHAIAHLLLSRCSEDDIQDLFQTSMDQDGYFDEVTR